MAHDEAPTPRLNAEELILNPSRLRVSKVSKDRPRRIDEHSRVFIMQCPLLFTVNVAFMTKRMSRNSMFELKPLFGN